MGADWEGKNLSERLQLHNGLIHRLFVKRKDRHEATKQTPARERERDKGERRRISLGTGKWVRRSHRCYVIHAANPDSRRPSPPRLRDERQRAPQRAARFLRRRTTNSTCSQHSLTRSPAQRPLSPYGSRAGPMAVFLSSHTLSKASLCSQ